MSLKAGLTIDSRAEGRKKIPLGLIICSCWGLPEPPVNLLGPAAAEAQLGAQSPYALINPVGWLPAARQPTLGMGGCSGASPRVSPGCWFWMVVGSIPEAPSVLAVPRESRAKHAQKPLPNLSWVYCP